MTDNLFIYFSSSLYVFTEREAETSRVKMIRIGANSAASANFLITPNDVGYMEVKATAVSPLAGDGVSRKLLVKVCFLFSSPKATKVKAV